MPILFVPVVTDEVPADPLIVEPTSVEEIINDMD
jgi:hypothetical protein